MPDLHRRPAVLVARGRHMRAYYAVKYLLIGGILAAFLATAFA
jgi:hypothetical protein